MPKEKDKKPLTVYYFKFALFILLIGGVLILGKIAERNVRNQKVLGTEIKKITNTRSLTDEIKQQTEKMAKDLTQSTQKIIDNVLGEATKAITNTASSGAIALTDYVFDSTVGNLVKQIDKLSTRQQEEIKKNICK